MIKKLKELMLRLVKKIILIKKHHWIYEGLIFRKCLKTGRKQKMIDYDAFTTTWVDY